MTQMETGPHGQGPNHEEEKAKDVKGRREHTLQAEWGGSQETWRPISVLAGFSFQKILC